MEESEASVVGKRLSTSTSHLGMRKAQKLSKGTSQPADNEHGSVSPSKARARSTGPVHGVRRSRADTAHKLATRESSASTAQPSAPVTTAAASSVASQRLSRVKSMPSKLNADQKPTDAAKAPTPTLSAASAHGRTSSAKRATKPAMPSQATMPSSGTTAHPTAAKPMPTAPKPMAPRAVPKEPKSMKEVTLNKPVTSHKVVVKTAQKTDSTHVAHAKPSSDAKVPPVSGAEEEHTATVKKPATTADDDYKAKLAENRRLAREKAERESAEEKARAEERKRQEEEQRRAEELEQQRREEEELRLAEEAQRLEHERYLRAVEEQERKRQEDEQRLEMERREKEALEQQAQEEAERKEKERLEKAQREEQERLERKKKLEMIMKRVKTDEGSLQKSDKLSSPVGSLVEGLNREPSTEILFTARTTSAAAADSDASASSQFRSPLLRQMMGNKLAAGGRPASATDDDAVPAASTADTSVSDDSETAVEMAVSSAAEINQPSAVAAPSVDTPATDTEDEIAVSDEPLEPSPRIPAPSSNETPTSTELATPKRVPIEVWTEDTTVDPASCQQDSGEAGLDDMDALCIEDRPVHPSPSPAADACLLHGPDNNSTSDTQPQPSSSRSGDSTVGDRDELCVDDLPSEPSTHPDVEIRPLGKPEERTSVVDEDRDIDTTEALASETKVDSLMDPADWNGVENSHVGDWPSTAVNGYPDDDVRIGTQAVASNEDVAVGHGSGDQVLFDQIIDLADSVGGTPALGDGALFTDNPPAKSAPLIVLD